MGQRRPACNTIIMEQIVRISSIAAKVAANGYVIAPTKNGSGRGWLGLCDEAGNLVVDPLLLSAKTFAELSNMEDEDCDDAVLNLKLSTVTTQDGSTVTMAVRDGANNMFAGTAVRMFGK